MRVRGIGKRRRRERVMRIVEAVRVGLRAAGVVSDLYRLAPEAVDVLQSGARLV